MSIRDLHEFVADSNVGLVIYTTNYPNDPQAMLELAAIIVHDRPMYCLVKRTAVFPEPLPRIAVDIEWYDGPKDFKVAAMKLTSRMTELMKSGKNFCLQ